MATSRIISNRLDSGAGAGFQISDCATPPYDDPTDPSRMAFPILKRQCVREILQVDDTHILTGADGGRIIKWWVDHAPPEGTGQQFAVAIERAWVAFHYTGAKVSDLQEHDPSTPIDPALDTPTDVTNILGLFGKLAANPLAVIALMIGFPMIAFGMYKGLQ